MATSPTYRPYQPPTTGSRFGYSNESDPRKLAANQRSVVQSTGDNLMSGDEQLANQYADQASGVEQYLDPIESNLAAGNGGYNQTEANQIQLSPGDKSQIQLSQGDKSQIEYSPQDVQDIVNKAGISAGQQTAASVNAAERAAAASGGSPAALATYRARAAQTGAANAADAETNARVAAKNAQSGAAATAAGLQTQGASTAQQLQSAGGQAVGNARIGQQTQGLGYYGGLQQEKNANALNEQGLQQGAFGTTTTGTGQAAGIGLEASKQPTTTDKVIGGIAGAASAFLADGDGYLDPDGEDAVVGENGMEAVINNAPAAVQRGASDPVRSNTRYMDNGDYGGETSMPASPWMTQAPTLPPAAGQQPGSTNGDYGGETNTPASPGPGGIAKKPNFLQTYLAKARQGAANPAGGGQKQEWTRATPYQQLGTAIGTGLGKVASTFADGQASGSSDQANEPDFLHSYLSTQEQDAPPPPRDDDEQQQTQPYQQLGKAIGSVASALADGQSGGGIGNYLADGDDGVVQTPDDYHRQADAALARERNNEGPGKGGAQYSDHDTYTSLANMAAPAVPPPPSPSVLNSRKVWPVDMTPLTTGDYYGESNASHAMTRGDYTPSGQYKSANRVADWMVRNGKENNFAKGSTQMEDAAGRAPTPEMAGYYARQAMVERAKQQQYAEAARKLRGAATNQLNRSTPQSPKADGRPPNGIQVGRAQVFTQPTAVRLNPSDSVVPLSYRAKAKVRPSAALPAMSGAQSAA